MLKGPAVVGDEGEEVITRQGFLAGCRVDEQDGGTFAVVPWTVVVLVG